LHGPLAAGAHSFIAVYSGDRNYADSTSPVEPLTVQQGTSTSATVIVDGNRVPVTSPVPLGTSVHDTATIGGQVSGLPATGTLTYEFFRTIDGTGPHTDEDVTLNPNGSVPDSALQGPLAAGAYSFIAVYSGDSNYLRSTSAVEPLTVESATSAAVTEITDVNGLAIPFPYEVPVGTSVHDTATIIGQHPGVPATGTVTYQFFTSVDGTGPHTDEVVTVNPNGSVPDSALHGPLVAGEYSFRAVYSGDSSYTASTSAVEPLTVPPASPAIVTQITDVNRVAIPFPYEVPLGTSVHDTATITGQHPGVPATGTVRYEFFASIDGTGPHTAEDFHLNPDGSVPDSALHGPLAAGSYSFIAVYSGDGNYAGSTSAVEPLTVQQGTSTSATVIVDANHTPITSPVPLGMTVGDTATVAGTPAAFTPTGTVTYQFFTTIDGTGPHTNQTVTLNPNGTVPDSALHGPLAAGAHSFIAVYSGDRNYADSTSPVEPLTVESATSAAVTEITDVNHVAIPFPYEVPLGTSVHDTAAILGQVSGVPATGTVTYQFFTTIDGTGLHTDEVVNLNSTGTVPDSALHGPLAAGSYSFIAVYSGDGNYAGSTSAVEPLTVGSPTPAAVTEITGVNHVAIPFPYEVPLGTSVHDTATIIGQHPGVPATGTVTYQFFTTIDGTGPHTDEVVTLNPDGTVPDSALHGPLGAGAYSFIAVYSGDSNYLRSTSAVEPLTVHKLITGQGASNFATVIVDANRVPATPPVPLGTSVHDTATIDGQVSGLPATGTVRYEFFTTIDGTGPHIDQTVTLNPDGTVPDSALHGPLGAGAYSFIAFYSGDSNYEGSTSAVEPLTIESGASAAVTQITDVNLVGIPFPYEVPLGTSVHDTATILDQVSGVPATGTVTYELFTTIDGTGPHTDEVVTLNPDGTVPASALHGPLAAGSYSFIAVYSGDSNYAGSTSAVEPLSVPPTSPAIVTEITDVNNVAVPFPYEVPLGTSVHDTATIIGQHPGVPATGTVRYEFFTTIDGTGPHTEQKVTLNPDGSVPASALHGPLAAGAYSFVAVYSGDSNYVGLTSAVEPLTVQQGASVAPTVISLQRFGFHAHPTSFVLTFSSPLDPARAQDPHNYTLRPVGLHGHLGRIIPIVAAVYNPPAHTVTLHPATLLYLFQRYELVVNGMSPAGLAGPSGVLLDGRGNGIPGSDYVKIFGPTILAGPHPPFPGTTRSDTPHSKSARTHSSIREPRSHHLTSAVGSERTHAAPQKAGPGRLPANAVDAVLGTLVSPLRSHGRDRKESRSKD
jgi:methyl coenzyme M reductase subunit D